MHIRDRVNGVEYCMLCHQVNDIKCIFVSILYHNSLCTDMKRYVEIKSTCLYSDFDAELMISHH